MKIERILVPVDFLESSKTALKFAIEIGIRNHSKIILLHTYRLMRPNVLLFPYFKSENYTGPELKKELENYSKTQFEKIDREVFGNIELEREYISEVGFTAHAIESVVDSHGIDLIVMGTTNSKKKKDFWGSNALEVIRNVKCPVLAIPDSADFKGIKKITLASDYKKVANSNIFRFIKNLVQAFEAEIQILNLSYNEISLTDEIIKAQSEFDSTFDGIKHSYHFKSCDDFKIGLCEHLKREKTDVLIIIPRDHSFFKKLFSQNLTSAVVLNSKIPLIAIRD